MIICKEDGCSGEARYGFKNPNTWLVCAKCNKLEKYKKLKYLDLSTNNITDISCLTKLTNLEKLRIYENHIENIRPLFNLNQTCEILVQKPASYCN